MPSFADPAAVLASKGQDLGHTDWMQVDQDRIDKFRAGWPC